MPNDQTVNEHNFQTLLNWLDTDRDSAGLKYERIRSSLIKIFAGRGCHEAEFLADETIDRVARKAPSIAPTYQGEPAHYFYGVAQNMHHEWLRSQSRAQKAELDEAALAAVNVEPATDENEYRCLNKCLGSLPSENRVLILNYYQGEKRARIERRQGLADTLGISPGALHIRISRLRGKLHKCVRKCVQSRH